MQSHSGGAGFNQEQGNNPVMTKEQRDERANIIFNAAAALMPTIITSLSEVIDLAPADMPNVVAAIMLQSAYYLDKQVGIPKADVATLTTNSMNGILMSMEMNDMKLGVIGENLDPSSVGTRIGATAGRA